MRILLRLIKEQRVSFRRSLHLNINFVSHGHENKQLVAWALGGMEIAWELGGLRNEGGGRVRKTK